MLERNPEMFPHGDSVRIQTQAGVFQTETLCEFAFSHIRSELLDPLPCRDRADALAEGLPLMQSVVPSFGFGVGIGGFAWCAGTAAAIPCPGAVAGIRIGGSSPALDDRPFQRDPAFRWPGAIVRQRFLSAGEAPACDEV